MSKDARRRAMDRMDELVEEWHTSSEDGIPLHEFLGMTWDEYGAWVRDASTEMNTPLPVNLVASAMLDDVNRTLQNWVGHLFKKIGLPL